ncbi:AAA family ATPase [Bacillus massiliigorillae]|uniref:AAA family ATPase n=1 Tax=Bacillus massiliigorillae TaxID=1243664 RepID=UPI00039C22CF|nr:AAA family ATPase [Bacillus massiliigorillae]
MTKWTPEKLYQKLKETVIGQDDYLKALSTTMWLHDIRINMQQKRNGLQTRLPKHNLLIVGPTGSGKTLALQELSKLYGYDLLIENAAEFTGTGYKGREVPEMINDLYIQCDKDVIRAEKGIIFLDEIDKVILSVSEKRRSPGANVENPLLKMIEGTEVVVDNEGRKIDTSNILFVAAGAFEGLEDIIHDRIYGKTSIGFKNEECENQNNAAENLLLHVQKSDLIKYGLNPQFIGRFAGLVALHQLSVDELKEIVLHSKASVVKSMDALLQDSVGVNVEADEAGALAIAEKSIMEKTGARGLAYIFHDILKNVLFDLPGQSNVEKILLTGDSKKNPIVKMIRGEGNKEIKEQMSSQKIIAENKRNSAEEYVDHILNSGRQFLEQCTIKDIRSIHLLLTSIVLYLLDQCNKEDQKVESIIKVLNCAREPHSFEERSVYELMIESSTRKDDEISEFEKVYLECKKLGITSKQIDIAIQSAYEFDLHPIIHSKNEKLSSFETE